MVSPYTQRIEYGPAPSATGVKSRYAEGGLRSEGGRVRQEDIRLSFAIMAHPKRSRWVEELCEDIPDAKVVWDRYNDRHDTGLRSIGAYDPECTHHVVVQDDVVLGLDFVEGIAQALKYVDPFSPVSFYHGGRDGTRHGRAVDEAIRAKASWLVRPGPIWGPAIAYPIRSISDLSSFFAESNLQNYDRRVMEFYRSAGIKCWYSVPSMVDHRQENNPSLSGHDVPAGRRARVFSGPQSLLDVGWDNRVVRFDK